MEESICRGGHGLHLSLGYSAPYEARPMHRLGRRPERTLQPPCRMHESSAPPSWDLVHARPWCTPQPHARVLRWGPGSWGQGIRPSLPSPPPLSHHMCAHAHAYMLEGSSQGVHPSWPAPCMDMSARTHGCLHVRLRTRAATNARRFRRRRPAWNGQELEDLVGTWAGKFRPGLPSGSGHGDVGSRGGGSGRGSGGGSLVFLAILMRLAR